MSSPRTTAGWVLMTLFWHFNGSILEKYQYRGQKGVSARTVRCLVGRLNRLFAVNAEKCWQMELFCAMTTLECIRQQRPLKRFENWNSSFLPPSIQFRSRPIWLPNFWTYRRCVTWTPICKRWRRQGCGAYVVSRATENIFRRWHKGTRELK